MDRLAGSEAAPSVEAGQDRELLDAMRAVIDPELGLDIVELGLVYEARRVGDVARVVMTLTSAACPLADHVVREVAFRLRAVPGVRDAEVQLVFEPPWTPARMGPRARALFGEPT